MDRPLGLAFGRVAATYDRVRPRYFLPLLDRAQEVLELGPAACVLDLGAGTGRLTRELVERFETVIAVEPEAMRAFLRVGTPLAGSADIPVADASVDAVFVGEAFHWFDPARALTDIARVLRPRGGLAVVWTHWWETDPPLPRSAAELLRSAYERTAEQRATAQHRRPDWDAAFEGSPFEPLSKEPFEEETTVDADGLLALYSTTSGLASLSQSERDALFAKVRQHLAGPYRLPIEHELNWARLA